LSRPNLLKFRKISFPERFLLHEWDEQKTLHRKREYESVGPNSSYVAGPVWNEDTILCGELNASFIKAMKVVFDQLGHYSRYDVATLALREEPWVPYVSVRDLAQKGLAKVSYQDMKRISEEVEVDMEKLEGIILELKKVARGF